MIGELLKLINNIRNEVDDLRSHGDMPYDSYDNLTEWLDEAEAIVKDYDR